MHPMHELAVRTSGKICAEPIDKSPARRSQLHGVRGAGRRPGRQPPQKGQCGIFNSLCEKCLRKHPAPIVKAH